MSIQNETLYLSAPLTKIPDYFLTQVHPENQVMAIFLLANKVFEEIKTTNWAVVNLPDTDTKAPDPDFIDKIPAENKSIKVIYDLRMSNQGHDLLSEMLGVILPPDSVGYYTALKFIEEDCLAKDVTKLSAFELLEIVKRINLCILQKVHPKGSYRDCAVFISDCKVMPKERNKETFKIIDKFIMDKSNTSQKELWKATRAKVWSLEFTSKKKDPTFTEEEKELVKGLISFTPDHEKVPNLMQEFAEELCKKVAAKEATDTLMSWTHQKLIEIHPFYDGNGRTARLFMNLLGMWAGKKPLLMNDNVEYTEASQSLDPAKFLDYLHGLESKQIQLHTFLEKCLRARFNGICEQHNCNSLCERVKIVKLSN